MSKPISRHIWTFEERRTVEEYCLANIDKMGSEISTMLIRDRVLPEELRYDQINSRVCATLAAIRAKQEVEPIIAEEPAKTEPEPTCDYAELLAAYTLLKLKYDAIMSAALDTPTELRINNPDKLFLNMGAIDRALRYCEPDRYVATVNELGGSEIVRRIKK